MMISEIFCDILPLSERSRRWPNGLDEITPLRGDRTRACKIKCVTGYHHCFINEGGVDDQEKYENRCAA